MQDFSGRFEERQLRGEIGVKIFEVEVLRASLSDALRMTGVCGWVGWWG